MKNAGDDSLLQATDLASLVAILNDGNQHNITTNGSTVIAGQPAENVTITGYGASYQIWVQHNNLIYRLTLPYDTKDNLSTNASHILSTFTFTKALD